MPEQILLVDKPAGWTSFDVVNKIRHARRAAFRAKDMSPTKRQLKVGHAGTLDPFATGLLVILLGDATKRAGEFLKLDKMYEAEFTLGATSSTGDPEGEIMHAEHAPPDSEHIRAALAQLTGHIQQTPPIYSAIKIGGKRAYNLARAGTEVNIPARSVHVHSLALHAYAYPHAQVHAHVGSGTYIRSLAVDTGELLGVGAYCSALRRTKVGQWRIEDACTIEQAIERVTRNI